MNLRKFTNRNDNAVYVNPDHVILVTANGAYTVLHLSTEDYVEVKEKIEDVVMTLQYVPLVKQVS